MAGCSTLARSVSSLSERRRPELRSVECERGRRNVLGMPPHPDPGDRGEGSIDLDLLRCSFCGKPRDRVDDMVCGPTPQVAICNECVDLVAEIMAEQRAGRTDPR